MSLSSEQIKSEQKAFERNRLDAGASAFMLKRHRAGKTWFGRKAVMPSYMDNWTEGQWLGWLARAELDTRPTAPKGTTP